MVSYFYLPPNVILIVRVLLNNLKQDAVKQGSNRHCPGLFSVILRLFYPLKKGLSPKITFGYSWGKAKNREETIKGSFVIKGGLGECTLVPVLVVPSFRFFVPLFRLWVQGKSARTTLLETTLLRSPEEMALKVVCIFWLVLTKP